MTSPPPPPVPRRFFNIFVVLLAKAEIAEAREGMAMVGSASRASRGNTTMSGSSTDDNPPARPRPRNGRGGGGESEGSEDEVTERGSEVCQIGDDMCTVPSQLFDLPSLKGVLSLNTWNYCLTGSQISFTHLWFWFFCMIVGCECRTKF